MSNLERAKAGWAKALEGHPFVTVDDLLDELSQVPARAYWWAGESSDVFTRIEGDVLEMGPVAGDVDEMMTQMLPQIEAWARQMGCKAIHVQAGRSAWSRVLKPRGYEEAAVILRKSL